LIGCYINKCYRQASKVAALKLKIGWLFIATPHFQHTAALAH